MEEEKHQNRINTVKIKDYIVDAFVALGGGADQGGYVNKNVLIETIKR